MFLLLLFNWLFASEVIHVRLFQSLPEVVIESENLSIANRNIDQKKIRIRFDKKWIIYSEKPILVSKNAKKLKIKSKKMRLFHLNLENMEVHLSAKPSGIDVIAQIPMNEYLKGVIPAEMPASWPEEALKAQVVASKSYVLSQIKEKQKIHFDVDASIMDQVYNLDRYNQLPHHLKKKVRKAIEETKDLYLLADSDVLKAYFHSHCGGHTENPKKVWQSEIQWLGVNDPYCNGLKPLHWNYKLTKEEFEKKAAQFFREKVVGLNKIVEGKANRSGRLEEIFLFFDDGRIRSWKTQDLRKSLGFSNVKSTQMKVGFNEENISFSGNGYGHGVGMCQHGAKKMASLGKSYQEILGFYYPKAKLARFSEDKSLIAHKD